MILIHKKRIQLMIICLLMGLAAFSFQIANRNESVNTQQTTATPVSGKIIIVDAGHGSPDERSRK